MSNIEEAARKMYAAQDRVNATEKGTDEYLEARMELATAREEYNAAYTAKIDTYASTITRK